MATKKPLFGKDIDEVIPPTTIESLRAHGFYPAAVLPLLANDQSIGTLSVAEYHRRIYTDDEISLLSAFADQAALALEKARLLNEAETRERQATQLYEVTTQLASNHDLDSVLDIITEQGFFGGR